MPNTLLKAYGASANPAALSDYQKIWLKEQDAISTIYGAPAFFITGREVVPPKPASDFDLKRYDAYVRKYNHALKGVTNYHEQIIEAKRVLLEELRQFSIIDFSPVSSLVKANGTIKGLDGVYNFTEQYMKRLGSFDCNTTEASLYFAPGTVTIWADDTNLKWGANTSSRITSLEAFPSKPSERYNPTEELYLENNMPIGATYCIEDILPRSPFRFIVGYQPDPMVFGNEDNGRVLWRDLNIDEQSYLYLLGRHDIHNKLANPVHGSHLNFFTSKERDAFIDVRNWAMQGFDAALGKKVYNESTNVRYFMPPKYRIPDSLQPDSDKGEFREAIEALHKDPAPLTPDKPADAGFHEKQIDAAPHRSDVIAYRRLLPIWEMIDRLPHTAKPYYVDKVFKLAISYFDFESSEIMLSRDEIADRLQISAKEVSRAMGVLEREELIFRMREKVAGMSGRGIARYFLNKRKLYNFSGN